MYLTLVSLEETFAYSGYSTVPTNFILGGIARRTDDHVLCGGEGNYGCWGLLDDVVNEADRQDVVGRVRMGSNKVGDKMRKRMGNGDANEKGGRRRKAAARSSDDD